MPFPLLEKGRLIPISWVVRVYMYVCVRVGVCVFLFSGILDTL